MITTNPPPSQETNAPPVALIVEDNHLVAETLADGLTTLGYAVVETTNTVKGALDAVSGKNVVLAVLETDVRGQSTEPVLEALDESDVAHVVASSDGCNPLPGHAHIFRSRLAFRS